MAGAVRAQPQPGPAFHFVEAGREAGLDAPTWCGSRAKPHILESGGTGVALLDVEGDGDLDLYLTSGWRTEGEEILERGRNRLYRNRGDGTFEDVTEVSGTGDDGWATGVAVGDADGDGRPDLFVSNFGADVLYLNRSEAGGEVRFERVANGPGIDGWSSGAVFFDADRDGDLDLFVGGYIDCTLEQVLGAEPELDWEGTKVMKGPFGLEGLANRYFENLGGGELRDANVHAATFRDATFRDATFRAAPFRDATFRDATAEAGLGDAGHYYSFGVLAADLDGDLDLDLYVANDSNPNYLYQNDGSGRFQEVGLWSGAALDQGGMAQAGMGVAAADPERDGRLDLFVTNFYRDASTFYRNLGDLIFEDATQPLGLEQPTFDPLSWGVVFEDFDLDGRLEAFVANGHIYPQADQVPKAGTSYRQRNLLLSWDGRRFVDLSGAAGPGLLVEQSSRGLAAGDLDNDGDVDLVVTNMDEPPSLLRNDTEHRGAWLTIDAPGALRVAVSVAGRTFVRHAVYGGSYVSASDSRFHFGLGPVEGSARVAVTWPDGAETVREEVATGRVVSIGREAGSGGGR
jgi:hypothetical protein